MKLAGVEMEKFGFTGHVCNAIAHNTTSNTTRVVILASTKKFS